MRKERASAASIQHRYSIDTVIFLQLLVLNGIVFLLVHMNRVKPSHLCCDNLGPLSGGDSTDDRIFAIEMLRNLFKWRVARLDVEEVLRMSIKINDWLERPGLTTTINSTASQAQ